ncbi:ATP-binding region, ATPase-like domain protein [Candidatus Magnetomorum sp. HK-1]|nr:ATP-binding region, ATPase-like domain protein [Candidatus Magnetomorum sp. HK-1]
MTNSFEKLNTDLTKDFYSSIFEKSIASRVFCEKFAVRQIPYTMVSMITDNESNSVYIGDKKGDLVRFSIGEIRRKYSIKDSGVKKIVGVDRTQRDAAAIEIFSVISKTKHLKLIAVAIMGGNIAVYDFNSHIELKSFCLFNENTKVEISYISQPSLQSPLFVSCNDGTLYICKFELSGDNNLEIQSSSIIDLFVTSVCQVGDNQLCFGTQFGDLWVAEFNNKDDGTRIAKSITSAHKNSKYFLHGEKIKKIHSLYNLEIECTDHVVALVGSNIYTFQINFEKKSNAMIEKLQMYYFHTGFNDIIVSYFEKLKRIYIVGVTTDGFLFWQQIKSKKKIIQEDRSLNEIFEKRRIYFSLESWSKGIGIIIQKDKKAVLVLTGFDQNVVFYDVIDEKNKTEELKCYVEKVVSNISGLQSSSQKRLAIISYVFRRYHGHNKAERQVQWAMLRVLTDYLKPEDPHASLIKIEKDDEAIEFIRCLGWCVSNSNYEFCRIVCRRLSYLAQEGMLSKIPLRIIQNIINDIQTYIFAGDTFLAKRYNLLNLVQYNKRIHNHFDARLYASILRQRRYDIEWEHNIGQKNEIPHIKITGFKMITVHYHGLTNPINLFICNTTGNLYYIFNENGKLKSFYVKNLVESKHIESKFIIEIDNELLFISSNSECISIEIEKLVNIFFVVTGSAEIETKKIDCIEASHNELNYPNGKSFEIETVINIDKNSFIIGTQNGKIFSFKGKQELGEELFSHNKFDNNPITCMDYFACSKNRGLLAVASSNGIVSVIMLDTSENNLKFLNIIVDFIYDNQGVTAALLEDIDGHIRLILSSNGGLIHCFESVLPYKNIETKKTNDFQSDFCVIAAYESPLPIIKIKRKSYDYNLFSKDIEYYASCEDGSFYALSSDSDVLTTIRIPLQNSTNDQESMYKQSQSEHFAILNFFQIDACNKFGAVNDNVNQTKFIAASQNGTIIAFKLLDLITLYDFGIPKHTTNCTHDSIKIDSKHDKYYCAAISLSNSPRFPRLCRWLIRELPDNTNFQILIEKLKRLIERKEYISDTPILIAHIGNLIKKLTSCEEEEELYSIIIKITKEWGEPGSKTQIKIQLILSHLIFYKYFNNFYKTERGRKFLRKAISLYLNSTMDFVRFIALRCIENYIENIKDVEPYQLYDWLATFLLKSLNKVKESLTAPEWVNIGMIRLLSSIVINTKVCPVYIAYELRKTASNDPNLIILFTNICLYKCRSYKKTFNSALTRLKRIKNIYTEIRGVTVKIKNNKDLLEDDILGVTKYCRDEQYKCTTINNPKFHDTFIHTFDALSNCLSLNSINMFKTEIPIIDTKKLSRIIDKEISDNDHNWQVDYSKFEYYKNSLEILDKLSDFNKHMIKYSNKIKTWTSEPIGDTFLDENRENLSDIALLCTLKKQIIYIEKFLASKQEEQAYFEYEIFYQILTNWRQLVDNECQGDVLIRLLQRIRSEADHIANEIKNNPSTNYAFNLKQIITELFERFYIRTNITGAMYVYEIDTPNLTSQLDFDYTYFSCSLNELDKKINESTNLVLEESKNLFNKNELVQQRDNRFEELKKIFETHAGVKAHVFSLVSNINDSNFIGFFLCWSIDHEPKPLMADLALLNGLFQFVLSTEKWLEVTRSEIQTYRNMFKVGAHQLYSPLLSMRYKINEVLLPGYVNPSSTNFKHYIQRLNKNNEELISEVDNLLEAKYIIEERINEIPIEISENIDFYDILDSLVNEFRDTYRTSSLEINFNRNMAAYILGRFMLNIDMAKIKAIIRNILSNACKYSEAFHHNNRSFVTIEIHILHKNNSVVVQISDNGPGIPDGNKIYEVFYRDQLAYDLNISGYGLGLPIANAYIERLGGSLTLKSIYKGNKVVGSSARIEIPSLKK